ncbi:hypothetical protein LMG27952_06612 [Paraburkholderia hiiakae]|uniref:Nitrile hydratase beta subunit-like N-terminal domain-containing protein n=1 Tax=Paraburkholderia hiiakae TaxID=1081782 RepID=A0ABM8P7H9_9BURK|nr:nitrile hydratase accessory protein [Paraburkholderia hiiakae]CAD6558330.1 hypothetical protein LMG27952_06612 [Paraburkholderia hiiakae]
MSVPFPSSLRQVGDDEPIFRAPWEASAFAMAVLLCERGLFTWEEWTQALAAHIGEAQAKGDPDLGDTYYGYWLAALESLVASKGASCEASMEQGSDTHASRPPN